MPNAISTLSTESLHLMMSSGGTEVFALHWGLMPLLWQRLAFLLLVLGHVLRVSSRTVVPTPPHATVSTPVSILLRQPTETVPAQTTPLLPPEKGYLDYITMIVVCGVVAFCFGICIFFCCRRHRRKLQRQRSRRFEDLQPNDISPTTAETDGAASSAAAHTERSDVQNRSPYNTRRGLESPPPTYSIIERQTSFTSHVSQTSSMIEVPPLYDDDWDPEKSVDSGASLRPLRSASGHGRRPGGRNGVQRAESGPSAGGKVPPTVGGRRAKSDGGDNARRKRRRQVPGSRPATVSEDEVFSEADTTLRSIDVIAEVSSRSSAEAAAAESVAGAESIQTGDSMRPLVLAAGGDSAAKDQAATKRYCGPSTAID